MSDYTPAQVMATTLGELVENSPADAEEQPITVLTISDPVTGDTYPVRLAPGHVETLNEAFGQLLQAAYAARDADQEEEAASNDD
ncbi:hypothetical protein AB0F17_65740 [Nonomuraea sp. NPDC026600]|uniref:hypothetical protein n=1 Tax=Nonomuraea sp. NPDC026600 TaxID=3155363 RepID=UPI0033F0E357